MTTVRYSPIAAQAIAHLKAYANDIDVYVEDSSSKELWLKFLSLHLPNSVRLNSVICLSGRNTVVEACKLDQGSGRRRRLYIIDGDLDLLTGRGKPRLKHLYRLQKYCFENHFLTTGSILFIVSIFVAGRQDKMNNIYGLKEWTIANRDQLTSLFVCYAVHHSLNAGLETVGYSCHRLTSDINRYDFCRKKVSIRVFSLYRKLLRIYGNDRVREKFNVVVKNIESKSILDVASGKYYIIPLIYIMLKKKYNINVNHDVFNYMLVESGEICFDRFLKLRIFRLLGFDTSRK